MRSILYCFIFFLFSEWKKRPFLLNTTKIVYGFAKSNKIQWSWDRNGFYDTFFTIVDAVTIVSHCIIIRQKSTISVYNRALEIGILSNDPYITHTHTFLIYYSFVKLEQKVTSKPNTPIWTHTHFLPSYYFNTALIMLMMFTCEQWTSIRGKWFIWMQTLGIE